MEAKLGRIIKLKKRKIKGPKSYVRGKIQVRNVDEKCVYCNRPGITYRKDTDDYICSDRTWDCPGYKDILHNKLVEAQNRDEVKNKKSIAMLTLHNQECKPCKEFQDNYKKGRETFSSNAYKRYYKSLINSGYKKEDIPVEYEDRKKLVILERWKLKARRTNIDKMRGIKIRSKVSTIGSLTIVLK